MSFLDQLEQTSPTIPVMSRFAKSWPNEPEHTGNTIDYQALGAAFRNAHATDAHFSAYSMPTILRRLGGRRVLEEVAPMGGVPMALFVLDVEPAGHATVTPEWWAAELAKLSKLLAAHPAGYIYRTRGGYRVVYELAVPVVLRTDLDAERWKRTYIAWLEDVKVRFEIEADPTCKDWTRLYRLPFVVRDGVVQTPEVIGDPALMGCWSREVTIAEPTAAEFTISTDVSSFGPASPALIERSRQRLKANGPAIEGQNGDNKTYSVCAALLHDYALSESEAWPLLLEWNETCVPPWALDDLQVKMANGRAHAAGIYGAGRIEFDQSEALRDEFGIVETPTLVSASGKITDPTVYPELETLDAAAEAYNVLDGLGADPVGETLPEPGTWGHALHTARADIASALGTSKASTLSTTLFTAACGLFDPSKTWVTTPWLVRGLLAEGGVVGIIGEPKSTKSWLALDIAIAVSSGQKALGEFDVPRPRAAAYFFAEDLELSIRNRIRSFAAGLNIDPATLTKNLYVQPRGEHLDLTRDEDLARIVASCRAIGNLGLLVLDPLRDIHTGKENESDDMSTVFARLRLLANMLGCTVLVPHHAKKPSKDQAGQRAGNDIRGSSAIYGALDGIISLRDLKETQTDKQSVFANTVKAEVKGAKSAGTFNLELTIKDGEDDTAIRATWKYERQDQTRASEAAADLGVDAVEDIAIDLLDQLWQSEVKNERLYTVKELRKNAGIGKPKVDAALAAASAKLWVRKNDAGRWALTDKGRDMARKGRRPASEQNVPTGLTLDEALATE